MVFNSLSFFIFFPVVTLLYYLMPFRWRWVLLLIASCIFYAAFIPAYILVLFYLIAVDYIAGRTLEKTAGKLRFRILVISLASNLGVLFFFKYFNFFQTGVAQLGQFIHWNYSPYLLQLILPIGLSFHTFQSISYVVEVYKGNIKAERHIGIYGLFVLFFPQLVAGPIERPQHMLPQLHTEHVFDAAGVTEGLRRILLGLFKKMIIADRLAILVNQIYGAPREYTGFPLLLATVAFAFQVYCDFSGYSDIAIGAARCLGIKLSENFNQPYLAGSISSFWRRWHISLYSWFRDYVYIPLGGNRRGIVKQFRNILIVFSITGLWHGANWTYVIWGLIHGVYMGIHMLGTKVLRFNLVPSVLPQIVRNILAVALTFYFVCFAWIFFRANTLADAWYIATHASVGLGSLLSYIVHGRWEYFNAIVFGQGQGLGLTLPQIGIAVAALAALLWLEYVQGKTGIQKLPVVSRWVIYVGLVLAVINLGPANQVPFIYFQF